MSSDLKILFEDQDLVAIEKPAGLPSQPTQDKRRKNIFDLLKAQRPDIPIFLHHRLDLDTSGVMLFGKSERINKPLGELFKNHEIQKTYVFWAKKGREIKSPHWTVKNHLAPVKGTNKQIMRMVVVKSGGWAAETDFKLLQETEQAFLIEAQPKTGRTHQIRVHTAQDRRPIFGDRLYGGKSELASRMLLHAHKLSFVHPITAEQIELVSPIPIDFKLRGD
jgi:RluA family pseudouridine synthase